jgi:uncharacterized protein
VRKVFVDTGFWIGVLHDKDTYAQIAQNLQHELINTKLVTTTMILTELLNGLSKYYKLRDGIAQYVQRLLNGEGDVQVIEISPALYKRAVKLYGGRQDKQWSHVDCASSLVMEELGIKEAISFDGDFQEWGKCRVLPG